MSTRITAENGIEIVVIDLGISVIDHEDQTERWARLSPDQRLELAAALAPEREGYTLSDLAHPRTTLANTTPTGRQWTRDDLPRRSALRHRYLCSKGNTDERMDQVALAVVEHLEKFHPKPDAGPTVASAAILQSKVRQAEREREELEAANEQLHREWTAVFIRATHAEAERDELRAVMCAEKNTVVRVDTTTKENQA